MTINIKHFFRKYSISKILTPSVVLNKIVRTVIAYGLRRQQNVIWILETIFQRDYNEWILNRILQMDYNANYCSVIERLSDKYSRKGSFSQTGEDILVEFVFEILKVEKPSYIDIGAYNPRELSNTALLYLRGSRGINIEPNPDLFKKFPEYRKEDINLNVGIYVQEGEMNYYVMDSPTLNTFSKEEAVRYVEEMGHQIINTTKIKVTTLDNVLKTHFQGIFPDFLSLDAEGVDELIVKSIDYRTNAPKVICVETISYSKDGRGAKNRDLIRFLEDNGYFVFADTYINTIFVRKDVWNR